MRYPPMSIMISMLLLTSAIKSVLFTMILPTWLTTMKKCMVIRFEKNSGCAAMGLILKRFFLKSSINMIES